MKNQIHTLKIPSLIKQAGVVVKQTKPKLIIKSKVNDRIRVDLEVKV